MPADYTRSERAAFTKLKTPNAIQRFLDKPTDPATRILATPPAPPGAPIGDRGMDYLLGIVCDWK